jgi:hypothetical protein
METDQRVQYVEVNRGTCTIRQDWIERTKRGFTRVIKSDAHESNGPMQQRVGNM